ncbi:hypothetical protein [Staphylococcus caprae]|uniref:hypothetical protein n=1 Tax=Staphylococcus caprae TaxID=29380 RepID=UPI001C8281B0|nr:hypothetical protein [Staphylococcus caprae]MBX5318905.1 hypothetical protein [Staphylococcus caprae]MDI9230788.1 hypothetical protein [Staphylococcus caprae]
MLMPNPILGDEVTDKLKKEMEKRKITGVIAPEHFKKHHDHENEMKAEEKALITQTMSHCHAFSKNFKSSAKGDWVDSAMSELDKISNNLKNIMD